jgi:hypothetical protein
VINVVIKIRLQALNLCDFSGTLSVINKQSFMYCKAGNAVCLLQRQFV